MGYIPMKIDAIQSNCDIFYNNTNNKSKKTSFCAVYTQPYEETLKVIRYNIDKNGMDRLGLMSHHLEWSKKWDMLVSGYCGRFHFQAFPKENPESRFHYQFPRENPKEPVLDVLDIEPLKKQPDGLDREFEVCTTTYNHNDLDHPFANKKSFKLLFNDSNTAQKAYDTLFNNYNIFMKTLWVKTRKSNFERIRMAEENFKILEKSEILNV